MLKRLMIIGMLIVPSMLYGWGNDVLVDVLRSSEGEYPIDFDVVVVGNTAIAAIGTNIGGNFSIYIYKSPVPILNWQYLRSVTGFDRGGSMINLDYLSDTVYIMILNDNYTLEVVKINPTTGNLYWSGWVDQHDSVTSAYMKVGEWNGHPRIYIAAITRGNNTDTIKVFRDIGAGFQKVYQDYYQGPFIRTVRQMDVARVSDSAFIYMVYERLDTTTNLRDIYYFSWIDDLGTDNFSPLREGYWIAASTDDDEYAPSFAAIDSFAICLYTVNNDIKYVYSKNYMINFNRYDLPFNTPDSSEWSPAVKSWYSYNFRGFDLLYIYGYNLYYSMGTILIDSISWNPPALISNQVNISYYIFRNKSIFSPKLENGRGGYLPIVMWSYDYWHMIPPFIFVYDSTYFLSDHMSATRIREFGRNENAFGLKVNAINRGLVKISFSTPNDGVIHCSVVSADGRVVKEFIIPAGSEEFSFPVNNFKKGVYFIYMRKEGKELVQRFIID
jgi:hypothetical protein